MYTKKGLEYMTLQPEAFINSVLLALGGNTTSLKCQ